MEYLKRLVDDQLDELLKALPAIAIQGARGVGKTTTARIRAGSVFQLEKTTDQTLVQADARIILEEEAPVLVDEWLQVPEVWNVVRTAVDEERVPGRFILTGSASPARDAKIHSGAGHILPISMRPLSLYERKLCQPTVSFAELLQGSQPQISGSSPLRPKDYIKEIVASGFPGIRQSPPENRQQQLEAYIDLAVERDLPKLGYTVRKPHVLRSWLSAYAAATATAVSFADILAAATTGEPKKPTRTTILSYREMLTRILLLDPLPAWAHARSPLPQVIKAAKHHLVDPALAAALIGVNAKSLLSGKASKIEDRTLAEALFESLVTLSVRVLAQHAGAKVYHLRTFGSEQEVDLIVEKPDGSILAIDTKLSTQVTDKDAHHLVWLDKELGARVLDRVIINTGDYAYRRPDGIAVVPLGLLGP